MCARALVDGRRLHPSDPSRVLRFPIMLRAKLRARAAALLLGLCGAAFGAIVPKAAQASVSIAATWDGLLRESTAVAIVTPTGTTSVWENGRIYSYTQLSVDRAIAGPLTTGGAAVVRTLGGIVGNLGQEVEGEAVFAPGKPSLVFLRADAQSAAIHTFEVAARGQGQFPVVAVNSQQPARVVRSHNAGMIVLPRVPSPAVEPLLAADVLHGSTVDDAARNIQSAWERLHVP